MPEDWRSAVIVPLYKRKGVRDGCRNFRGISLLSVAGKIYEKILVDRLRRMTEGFIGDEQGSFRLWKGGMCSSNFHYIEGK